MACESMGTAFRPFLSLGTVEGRLIVTAWRCLLLDAPPELATGACRRWVLFAKKRSGATTPMGKDVVAGTPIRGLGASDRHLTVLRRHLNGSGASAQSAR